MSTVALEQSRRPRRRIRVLVFPCGSENAGEIYQALRYSLHVELFGASSVEDHGRFRFARYCGGLPNIRDSGFDSAFIKLIAKLRIDVVFATHDSVLEYLATRASQMRFFLVNGDPVAAAATRRKSATYRLFLDRDWTPLVFGSAAEVREWPIVVKPDRGQGGQEVAIARGPDEVALLCRKMQEPILVEYLPGEEITVDCFTDRNRRLVWMAPRTRERVRAGITMRSTFVEPTPEICAIAVAINERLNLRGPWFFQLKADRQRRWKLLEVSCRVAGAMVAQRARGINLPLLAIHDYMERDLTVLPIPQVKLIDRNIATRAELDFDYDVVFVDLDDTLLIDQHANPIVLAFLYQSIRDGKQVRLITRHAADIAETLHKARVSMALFDEIIHLPSGVSKADCISQNAIFIDNHFPERLDVARKLGIPVFDTDAIEFFIK